MESKNMKRILIGFLLIFSFNSIAQTEDKTWTLSTSNAGWGARWLHSTVEFDNKIWIIGGATIGYEPKNDVWYSNDGTNWTQATSSAAWEARTAHTSVVHNNKMWIIGGGLSKTAPYRNDVWYSSDGVNWTQAISSAPWSARRGHTSVVFHDKIWVIGGSVSPDWCKVNDVWYSGDGVNWTQATGSAQWCARSGLRSVVFNDKIWVIGGNGPDQWDAPNHNDVWYSSDGINWTQATSSAPFEARSSHSSVIFDNKIWVIGGDSIQNPKNDVWNSNAHRSTTVGILS
jgi:hypothetical protein